MYKPAQDNSLHPELLCKKYGISYVYCKDDTDIDGICGVYRVTGAGILFGSCIHNKKIINCLSWNNTCRKRTWSIYNMYLMGLTLHYIDENVDEGKVICILEILLYNTDTLEIFVKKYY